MSRNRLLTSAILVLGIVLGTIALDAFLPVLRLPAVPLPDLLQNFVTVFLGIFIEAVPFLLLGSLASGLIAEFVSADDIARLYPRNKVLATGVGTLMGMAFPVCECGVVPVVRRLYQKGLPISAGIAFLLAAPVINPVVIASTYAAFGFSPIFWGRIVFTLLVAFGVGMVFSAQPNLARIVAPRSLAPVMGGTEIENEELKIEKEGQSRKSFNSSRDPGSLKARSVPKAGSGQFSIFNSRLQNAFVVAADDFFDMGRYLVLGALIATALQTFVPQSALLSVGRGPVTSVIALQVLAFVLSVCSTVDAFIALSFLGTFTPGAIVAFLVFGPMVDIKSVVMYADVFRPRVIFYIVALTFLATLLIGVFINLNIAW